VATRWRDEPLARSKRCNSIRAGAVDATAPSATARRHSSRENVWSQRARTVGGCRTGGIRNACTARPLPSRTTAVSRTAGETPTAAPRPARAPAAADRDRARARPFADTFCEARRSASRADRARRSRRPRPDRETSTSNLPPRV
jgi:hypothetical protein